MKKIVKLLGIGLMALAVTGFQFNLQAQDSDAPAAKEKAKQGSKKGTGPFNGKLSAIDKDAKTITIGKRTFKIVTETKVTNGSLTEAKVGDKVGGAFLTDADGKLVVRTIWFGAKPAK